MDAIVEFNYVAQESDELTLRKGDVIKDIKIMPGGWWEGTLRDKRGMFPDNFVKMHETTSSNSNLIGGLKNEAEGSSNIMKKEEITFKNSASGRKWCKVLYSYEPCNEDELPLIPDEIIEFFGEVEEGWWSGKLRSRVGVFPSNFVSPPISEDIERQQNKDRYAPVEHCRVLFPYTAANEDELTLIEDEIVTILSKDAPDKGWWKGSLRGKIGLFPDNFVKIIDFKKDAFEHEQEMCQDTNQAVSKISGAKPSSSSLTGKRGEKAHVRRSLESNTTSFISSEKKIINNSVASTNLKLMSERSHVIPSYVKMIGNAELITKPNEELDGVERKEDTPLLHLTASRAKAPRRRLPSSHHVRNQVGNTSTNATETQSDALLDKSIINGTFDIVDQSREEEVERLVCKTRRKVPWIEELKLNQMEKKKIQPVDKHDKSETAKKERNHGRSLTQSSNSSEINTEVFQDNGDSRTKEKERNKDMYHRTDSSMCSVSPTATSCQASTYVPYHLYCQLLERVSLLEERQTELQRIVAQLSEKLGPSLINASAISNNL